MSRQIFQAIEKAGYFYNGSLRSGGHGTYWVDVSKNKLYEFQSDNPDLSVDDLSDAEINSMVCRALDL